MSCIGTAVHANFLSISVCPSLPFPIRNKKKRMKAPVMEKLPGWKA